ncbi:MAG TPA: 5-formyltetrahydrofolate cyclo-ligase [Hanamia sp.]|jgi:5-formyltetrahydrofolate cyclo-ligase|nr:5-formyltetrahydrofolate cyclo-ligase [Hanamia sp.]
MTKKELRHIFKEKRKALSVHDIEKMNDLILINFQKLMLPFINCVHTYVASLKLGEPDTAAIVKYLKFRNPLIKIVIPKIDIHSGNISHYHFNESMEMITNAYGIDEPKEGNLISENEIDLVLIPLLAFDKKGFRVGFGKGYYDKFLARCKPNVIKTGLSFFDPVDEIKDISGFDIPLNFCITPKEIFSFSL